MRSPKRPYSEVFAINLKKCNFDKSNTKPL